MVEIKKINNTEWKIEKEGKMNVPVTIFASEKLIEKIKKDSTIEQAMNIASLTGVLENVVICPDAHQGYGACIGSVAAFDIETGSISPGEVGYDINCSIRLLKTNLKESDLEGKEKEITESLSRVIPAGIGKRKGVKLNEKELDELLIGGAQWAVSNGYGINNDWEHTEEEGKLKEANILAVSQLAKKRGIEQLGTLGAGNHFLDLLIVDEIFDTNIANSLKLEKGQVVILIHCGSRGLGHQVASDYIKIIKKKYGESAINDELVGAPIGSKLGQEYLGAMSAAANFAFANKQVITHLVREELKLYFPFFKAKVIYDVCHNIAKVEKHIVNGKEKKVLVVRKGATRAFGPSHRNIPKDYQKIGQPTLLPGSMGTPSYILIGTDESEKKSWGSCAHGAGRAMSRKKAHQKTNLKNAIKEMKMKKITVKYGKEKGMIEESPTSYKDIEEVAEVCDKSGIAKKIIKLRPKLIIIG